MKSVEVVEESRPKREILSNLCAHLKFFYWFSESFPLFAC